MFNKIMFTIINWILALRYRITWNEPRQIGKKGNTGMLFVANHPALIDPVIVMAQLWNRFAPRPLADETQMRRPVLKHFFNRVKPVRIPDVQKDGKGAGERARQAIRNVISAIENGDNVLLYPAGRIYTGNTEHLGANSAVETIVRAVPEVQINMVRTEGLWGSRFSKADGTMPQLRSIFPKALLALTASGLFFLPRRKVQLTLKEAHDFPRSANRKQMNQYMETFFNDAPQLVVNIPLHHFIRRLHRTTETATTLAPSAPFGPTPAHITKPLHRYLKQQLQIDTIDPQQNLATDLGMDSILKMELIAYIESSSEVAAILPEQLETVSDCYRAALGQLTDPSVTDATSSRRNDDTPLALPAGDTIAHMMLRQAQTRMSRPIITDEKSGAMTYRQFIRAIAALKPQMQAIEGHRIGVMLPASTAATIVYFAVMFAGKVPVMLNFTTGSGPFNHSVKSTGVRHIISADAFLQTLAHKGIRFDSCSAVIHPMESMISRMSVFQKLAAFFMSYIGLDRLRRAPIDQTAAILFTSGSESVPKAVPLSHKNIITNISDFGRALSLTASDELLAVLPPFHSFGLSGTVVLPLCMGLATYYYPNPTDSNRLSDLIARRSSSILLSTPTFLHGILQRPRALPSMRLVFVGAEKCSDAVYDAFHAKCPQGTLCEGYGITECSPVISMNDPHAPRQGSIGQVLPNVDYAIVNESHTERVPVDNTGILLVRGDSIFGGYLTDCSRNYHNVPSPFIHFENKQWYNTGDMVRANKDGVLTFQGRMKRFIKIAGEMISLPAMEQALLSSAELANCECAVVPHADTQLTLVATCALTPAAANAILRRSGLSGLHRITVTRQLDTLPKLGTGKTDYRTLQSLFAQDA